MDSQPHDKNRPEIMQMMTTEHYNLQSARSLALSDANGRAGLFLGTVSSTLIALAFVGNITHIGAQLGIAFFVFALVLFPSLFFLGLVTFDSVLQSAIEDAICVRGISRIRHLYVELAPEMQEYFILPTHDDATGIFRRARWWQSFLTLAGILAVINSILAGVFTGLLLAQLFAWSLLLCLMASMAVFVVILLAQLRYQFTQWRASIGQLKVLFPQEGGKSE
jgi:hypothetical protein